MFVWSQQGVFAIFAICYFTRINVRNIKDLYKGLKFRCQEELEINENKGNKIGMR